MIKKLAVVFILLPCLAHAAERKQNSIELGILTIEQASSLNTWSSNKRIENLASEPQSHSRVFVVEATAVLLVEITLLLLDMVILQILLTVVF